MNDAAVRVAEVGFGRESQHPLATRFTDLTALLLEPAFDAVILGASLEENRQMLHSLRAHPQYGLGLIYCHEQHDAQVLALADGAPAASWPALQSACLQHRERLAVFNNGRPHKPRKHACWPGCGCVPRAACKRCANRATRSTTTTRWPAAWVARPSTARRWCVTWHNAACSRAPPWWTASACAGAVAAAS